MILYEFYQVLIPDDFQNQKLIFLKFHEKILEKKFQRILPNQEEVPFD